MLGFSLGRIPVRIHASFFFTMVLLGATGGGKPVSLAIWVVVVLASVLLHELGHAVAGMAFGLSPQIDLHGMGGTTSWAHKQVGSGKRILISLAGPLTGIALGGVFYGMLLTGVIDAQALSPLAAEAAYDLFQVNVFWGVLNLLPILPLDGGNVMAEALKLLMGEGGMRAAYAISMVVAGAGCIASLVLFANMWTAMLAGMFAFQNGRALAATSGGAARRPPPAAPPPAVRW